LRDQPLPNYIDTLPSIRFKSAGERERYLEEIF
jgi:hypothetical protein